VVAGLPRRRRRAERRARPARHHHLFRSHFHDIVEGERIVFAYDLLLDGRLTSVSLTTVELGPTTTAVRT